MRMGPLSVLPTFIVNAALGIRSARWIMVGFLKKARQENYFAAAFSLA